MINEVTIPQHKNVTASANVAGQKVGGGICSGRGRLQPEGSSVATNAWWTLPPVSEIE